MADLPQNTGRSPTGVALDDSSGESSVPAWLAARRARGPLPRENASPEPAPEDEAEIEFASLPDSETDDVSDSAPPPSAEILLEPVRRVAAGPESLDIPKPVVPLPPPPMRRTAIDPVRLQPAPSVHEPPPVPVDNSIKGKLLRWVSSATMTGMIVSLVVHTAVLSILAVIVFKSTSVNRALDIFGIVGDPSDDLSQIELDSSMPIDPGSESAELEFSDFSQIASSNQPSFNPSESLRGGTGTGTGTGAGGEGDGIGVAAPNIPKYAVTKGSFSAWTDPKDPDPGKSYEIVIQFRLPPNVKSYKGSDLTGMVIGTDGYKQAIKFSRTESFPVQDGNIQVRIRVPGADRLVRDTIRIESKLLREKQMIEIEF